MKIKIGNHLEGTAGIRKEKAMVERGLEMLEMVRKMRIILEKVQLSHIRGLIISSKYIVGDVKLRNVKVGNDSGVEEISLCLTVGIPLGCEWELCCTCG